MSIRLRSHSLLLGIALFISPACSDGDEVVLVGDVDEPQVTTLSTEPSSLTSTEATPTDPPATFTPLLPDQPMHDGCIDPLADSTPPEAGLLRVDPSSAGPGEQIAFTWAVEGRRTFTTGDEMIISCWNAVEWMPVWFAFGTFGEPTTFVLTLETISDYVFTADGWSQAVGRIAIPPDAPSGTYRLSGTISFSTDAEPTVTLEGQADFIVSG